MHFLVRDRQDCAQHDMIATGGEAGQVAKCRVRCAGRSATGEVFDENAEQPLV